MCVGFEWLTLNRVQCASKDTRRLFRVGLFGHPTSQTTLHLHKCRTVIVWPGAFKDSHL